MSEQWRLRIAHGEQRFVDIGFRLLLLVREPLRPLRLSGPCGSAIGPRTSCLDLSVKDAIVAGNTLHKVVGIGQRSLRHAPERLAVVGLRVLLIGRDVERDEEHQVRRENTDASKSGELLAGTFAMVGHPGEVGGGEVGVRGEVYES